ncbi:hypothetical protein Stsp01_66570 [Streptomyces sp. NBRC 13847]|nr:hypothetical protein Stsp01_66570 [Streptomyces sp. NBRC 13847]
MGYAYLHTAIDDHSGLTYTEDLPDETALTCAAFLAVPPPGSPHKASPQKGPG